MSRAAELKKRGSGILLHITSLPSPYGIGDFGPNAYEFVDFLASISQRYWQILPLNPTGTYLGSSPYLGYSAFAGNPLLISPDLLHKEGFLLQDDLENRPKFSNTQVDFHAVTEYKTGLLLSAFHRFKDSASLNQAFHNFCGENRAWLTDYSLFAALKIKYDDRAWTEWPKEARDRKPEAIASLTEELSVQILMQKFYQFLAYRQWNSLKQYCNSKGVQIIGDLPIYVSGDSADTWSHPEIFKLDEEKNPMYVSGAPPDYYSKTGQRWGTPVYRWDVLKESGYSWWIDRIRQNLSTYDVLRLDHFRGFVAYWEVPAEEETAQNGKWVKAPAEDFFDSLLRAIPNPALIVEDLGMIDEPVRSVMKRFGFPGMKVLLFSFGDDMVTNPYIPHNYTPECVAYTGTHDNNTIQGWFEKEADEQTKRRVFQYLGRKVESHEIHWELIRLVMASVANITIVPLQDIIGLGEEARMNLPSQSDGNWRWRLLPHQIDHLSAERFREMTQIYGRG